MEMITYDYIQNNFPGIVIFGNLEECPTAMDIKGLGLRVVGGQGDTECVDIASVKKALIPNTITAYSKKTFLSGGFIGVKSEYPVTIEISVWITTTSGKQYIRTLAVGSSQDTNKESGKITILAAEFNGLSQDDIYQYNLVIEGA